MSQILLVLTGFFVALSLLLYGWYMFDIVIPYQIKKIREDIENRRKEWIEREKQRRMKEREQKPF